MGDPGAHLAPCVIPWKEDYTVDEAALRKHARYLADVPGMTGVVFNPHAGEVYSLTRDERLEILRIGVDELHGASNVVCGLSPSPDTNRAAVEFARAAEDAGADALLVMAPHWFAFGVNTQPEIAYGYLEEVARATTLPLLVYQLGSWTGAHYSIETLRRMCEIDSVVGVKMVTMDTQEFEDTVVSLRSLGKSIRIYTGNDNVMLYNYISGADGTLVGLHNSYAELLIEMFDAVKRGENNYAVELHHRQFEITRVLFAPPPMKYRSRYKAAAMLQGKLPSARLRPPLPEIAGEELDAIKRSLEAADLLRPWPKKVVAAV
jgi:4-hydroxy-tetrahydrodipicolinate synthase